MYSGAKSQAFSTGRVGQPRPEIPTASLYFVHFVMQDPIRQAACYLVKINLPARVSLRR